MSIRALNWAWGQEIRPTEKLLLLALSDHSNDEDFTCWPSLTHLAKKTGMDRATVWKSIERLIGMGLIERIGQSKHGTTLYRILTGSCPRQLVAGDNQLPKATSCAGRTGVVAHGNKVVAHGNPNHKEPSVEPAAPAGAPNIWDLGVSLLTSTGTEQQQARSFIGKLIKQHGEPATLSAVADAVNRRPADPRGWITKALQAAAKKQASSDIYTPARKAAGGNA